MVHVPDPPDAAFQQLKRRKLPGSDQPPRFDGRQVTGFHRQ
jgi:hypothetical protein